MKIVPFYLLAALLMLHGGASAAFDSKSAFEQRCERDLRPQLEVLVRDSGFKISNNTSSVRLSNAGGHNYAGDMLLGLTTARAMSEVEFNSSSLVDTATNRECLAPHVTVTLTLPPLDVYIAREFAPNSCAYREVYNHEMRHVQIYRELLPKLEERIRAELEQRFAKGRLYTSNGDGINTLAGLVDDWLRPMIRAGLADIENQQVAVDTPEEDHRLSHACFGEVSSRLGSHL